MIKKLKYLVIGLFLVGCFVSFYAYSFFFGVSVYQQTDFYLPTGSTYETLLNTLKKEVKAQREIINALPTAKDLQIEGLKSEKRMIQATDRKILDVQRQTQIEQEIKKLEK